MSANTLEEFLNENLHRNYPIVDSMPASDTTGSFTIPTELIADIQLTAPSDTGLGSGVYFISAVRVMGYTIEIEISYRSSSGDTLVGIFGAIPMDGELFSSYDFSADSSGGLLSDTTGTVIMGKADAAKLVPGEWKFDHNSTGLVPTVIENQLTKFRSIQVDSSIFTGNIVLEEGENVSIDADYDPVSDITTIRISATESESGDIFLVDDNSILDALTVRYGKPVTNINNIPPDSSGNFYIRGADCVAVDTLASGASVVITNPCGKPCCDEETYLTPVYDSLNTLNAKYATVESFYRSALDALSTLLSRLKDLENSVGFGGM